MLTKHNNKITKIQKSNSGVVENEQLLLDEIDIKILKILLHDCRISNREIARRLHISVNTVIDRLRKLETSKIIRGYYADLNAKKLGYNLTAVIHLATTKGLYKKVSTELSKLPNLYGVYEVTGNYDTIIVARFRDIDELEKFIKLLQKKDLIQRTETSIALKTIKEDFRIVI